MFDSKIILVVISLTIAYNYIKDDNSIIIEK